MQVDPERARKPLTHLPEGAEYHIEGNTKYAFTGNSVYLWDGRVKEWFPYSKHDAERHWKKITKK